MREVLAVGVVRARLRASPLLEQERKKQEERGEWDAM